MQLLISVTYHLWLQRLLFPQHVVLELVKLPVYNLFSRNVGSNLIFDMFRRGCAPTSGTTWTCSGNSWS